MSQKEFAEISSTDIENAISAAGNKFSLKQLSDRLCDGKKAPEGLDKRLERIIASDDRFFYDENFNCCTRNSFFNGRKFIITPDEWEINAGILYPGHRFTPFINEEIFPSTVQMQINGSAVPQKKLISPLGTAFHYHILLGSEQIFDFMLADDPANENLKHQASRTDSVTLSVFDMAEFYRSNDFLSGDALLCTVEDYDAGLVRAEFLSGSVRGAQARKDYLKIMDAAAGKVWNEFQDYLDIPEQLAWMVYYAGLDADAVPGASLDEFISGSEKVQLRPEGDHAVLTVADDSDEEHHHHHGDCSCGDDDCDEDTILPEGLAISGGETDPFKLLASIGSPLNTHELDGFILDAVYGRDSDAEGVKSRIFANTSFDSADEAQQAVLHNFIEERFEIMQENYNRADDEEKAEMRSEIMEAVSRRLDYLSMLGTAKNDPGEKELEKIRSLADIAAKLTEALKLLNHPGFTPDRQEKENLEIMVDDQLAIQEDILSDFSTEANQ